MKKFILLTSLIISTNIFADKLDNFDQIKHAITHGKTIHITVDFSKCTPSHNQTTNQMNVGIFTPHAIQVVNNKIATSLTHFTLNNPSFPDKPVYEFVRYTFTKDNNLNLTAQTLDARDYSSLSDKHELNCKINAGVKVYDDK